MNLFRGGGLTKSIVMQISFVMLIFYFFFVILRGQKSPGGNCLSGGAPYGRKPDWLKWSWTEINQRQRKYQWHAMNLFSAHAIVLKAAKFACNWEYEWYLITIILMAKLWDGRDISPYNFLFKIEIFDAINSVEICNIRFYLGHMNWNVMLIWAKI